MFDSVTNTAVAYDRELIKKSNTLNDPLYKFQN